jgi:hypothetical protein
MNEDRKTLSLEECLALGEEGVQGRIFVDGYAKGLYSIKDIITEDGKTLADGGTVRSLLVLYWDFADRPSRLTELMDLQMHYKDRSVPAELALMGIQSLPNARTNIVRGSTQQSILING